MAYIPNKLPTISVFAELKKKKKKDLNLKAHYCNVCHV